MKIIIHVREEKRGKYRVPVMSLDPLVTEAGDGLRIYNNAVVRHNQFAALIKQGNAATNEALMQMRGLKPLADKLP